MYTTRKIISEKLSTQIDKIWRIFDGIHSAPTPGNVVAAFETAGIFEYKSYTISRKLIEIVLSDSDHFDIISYIDFAIAVYEDYKALTGLRKNLYDYRANYKNFLDEDKESDTNLYSFHINISQNFKTINV